ncbi:reverse transcriptase [Plakobranchus ocellatus]|uniref:Reverse transcriptase n=1 Tax=Plakobranchus ocellatus TaxID=259542 RepID=A0AAV3ZVN0_9GAST|nr:reverse transcriptase [Plakobranchus ocellatus]
MKQLVLPESNVMSVAHDSCTGEHLGIRRTKDMVLRNFYWLDVDGDIGEKVVISSRGSGTPPLAKVMYLWMLIMYYFSARRGHIFTLEVQNFASLRGSLHP